MPQIEGTSRIDKNGIVSVSAKDKGTGNEQNITITSSSNMSEEEIQQRVKEAEQFAEADKKRKEEVETLNHADSLTYEMEKQLKENGDKLSAEDKAAVEKELADFKTVRERNNPDEIKTAMGGRILRIAHCGFKIRGQNGNETRLLRGAGRSKKRLAGRN